MSDQAEESPKPSGFLVPYGATPPDDTDPDGAGEAPATETEPGA